MSVKGFRGFKFSSTNWEESYFGGYNKVLYDYPEVKIDYSINIAVADAEKETKSEISWYNLSKLAKVFLLKVNEFNLVNDLSSAVLKEEVTVAYMMNKSTRYYANPDSIRYCVNMIANDDTEMGNLFSHFKEALVKIKFYYILDETEKEEDTASGEKGAARNRTLKMANLFGQTKKYEYNYGGSVSSGNLKKKTKFIQPVEQDHPTIYTAKQTLASNQLVNLLDISFDPKSDIVRNMKTGKLDTSKLSDVIAGNTSIYYKVEEEQTTKPFSVCILGDESGSMEGEFIEPQHNVIKILHKAFSQILPPDKLYVYGHSGDYSPEICIYQDKYNQNFENVIDYMVNGRELIQNYDGPVIETIYEKIRSFTDDNIIFIVISDGEPAGIDYGGKPAVVELKRVIEKCKRDGFVTVGIGLELGLVKEIYNYYTIIEDVHTELVPKVSKLINKVVKTEFQ